MALAAACGGAGVDMPSEADAGAEAGMGPVLWECECWTRFRISSLANEHGPVLLAQEDLPQGMLCATDDPSADIANELCSERTYYCDCAECVPTGMGCW